MFKYKIEKLDSVDENQRVFYKEHKDGGFILQVEGVVSVDDVSEPIEVAHCHFLLMHIGVSA